MKTEDRDKLLADLRTRKPSGFTLTVRVPAVGKRPATESEPKTIPAGIQLTVAERDAIFAYIDELEAKVKTLG